MKLNLAISAIALAVALPATQVAAEDWSGFYAGGSLGYSVGDVDAGDGFSGKLLKTSILRREAFGELDPRGADIGFHGGYRMQTGDVVYGAEIGARFSGLQDEAQSGGLTATLEAQNTLSLRGIVGADVDDTLIYGAAGIVSTDFGEFFDGIDNDRLTGYTIAVGAERMVSDTLSIRAELSYDQYNFDLDTGVNTSPDAGISQTRLSVGANFRF